MQITDLRREAVAVVEALRAASELIRKRTNADEMMEKGPLNVVTGTDLASQAAIEEILLGEPVRHSFVGEESEANLTSDSHSHWLVDPICGTSNFANRLPLYCVNIALVEQSAVVLGAVADPNTGEIWIAERGEGAWAVGGQRLSRLAVSPLSQTVSLDPGRPGGASADTAARVVAAAIRNGQWELRTLGTTLDLALVATGRLAGTWHFSRIPPLHFAAGALLALEAGGIVTDDVGHPWTTNSTSLVVAATPAVHASMLGLLVADN